MLASSSGLNSVSEEIAEMKWNLKRSEADLNVMQKQIESAQGKRRAQYVENLAFVFVSAGLDVEPV